MNRRFGIKKKELDWYSNIILRIPMKEVQDHTLTVFLRRAHTAADTHSAADLAKLWTHKGSRGNPPFI